MHDDRNLTRYAQQTESSPLWKKSEVIITNQSKLERCTAICFSFFIPLFLESSTALWVGIFVAVLHTPKKYWKRLAVFVIPQRYWERLGAIVVVLLLMLFKNVFIKKKVDT